MLVPILSTPEGSCLTSANLQEAQVKRIAFYLDALLVKPGMTLLQSISDLTRYVNWPGELILNASSLVVNKEHKIIVKSPYDGSKHSYSGAEIIALIQQIKPNKVILPANLLTQFPSLWEHWDEAILAYIPVEELGSCSLPTHYGVAQTAKQYSLAIEQHAELPRYLWSNIDWELIQSIKADKKMLVESNLPLSFAMAGQVWSKTGWIDLTSLTLVNSHEVIDLACTCPTCKAQLTKAYLSHLYQHTPLLAQRFLMQHNLYFSRKWV